MDSITCPVCGRTSYNPNDIKEGYCGNCHDWTSPPRTTPPKEQS
jgi:ribosomal protein L37E